MAKNKSGVETRKKILQACRELFYEKGFDKTTFQDISKLTDIVPSAIAYHYRSKNDLYFLVLDNLHDKQKKKLEKYLPKKDKKVYIEQMLVIYIDCYCAYKDEKFRRFVCLSGTDRYPLLSEEYYENYLLCFEPLIMLDKKADDFWLRLIECCVSDNGFARVILQDFDKYKDKFSFRDLAEKTIRVSTKFFPTNKEKFEEAFEEVKEILKTINWDSLDTTL